MAIVLGIHVGHHASCAVARDGVLVAAIQLERLTKRKAHTVLTLCDELPVAEALAAAGVSLDDVDLIVSSFQGIARAGFGLHQPLIAHDFSLFDPFDTRHHVISHHLAHAHCAIAYAPIGHLAVLVSDYAGSSTPDGFDFALPFSDWYAALTDAREIVRLQTECLSIYATDDDGVVLRHREFREPHVAPDSAVCSVASLYENITGAILPGQNQHGSLMALTAYGAMQDDSDDVGPLVDVDGDEVCYRNDWQHRIHNIFISPLNASRQGVEHSKAARLAWLCQNAAEQALLAYARRAKALSGATALAVAGGTFLNILANTRVACSGLFDAVYVPSAPNDAGISIGCAMWGARKAGDRVQQVLTDRLGPIHDSATVTQAFMPFVQTRLVTPRAVAERLARGEIVARFAGRAEFGPRALGGRSLLGSPLLETNKTRLNDIKGRQQWRPVAPIVATQEFDRFFVGPANSPWMTFSHYIRFPHALKLPALQHPDGSTRCQSHSRHQDEWLDDLLHEFDGLTGYPILLNTSLNGPDEPILEQPSDAIRWFLLHPDVDALLLDETLVTRKVVADFFRSGSWALATNVYRMLVPPSAPGEASIVVLKGPVEVHTLRMPTLVDAVCHSDRLVFPEEDRVEGSQLEFEFTELFLKDLIVNQRGSR